TPRVAASQVKDSLSSRALRTPREHDIWRPLGYNTFVPDAPLELDALVDLKMLPAWVNEATPAQRYAQHDGEDRREGRGHDDRRRKGKRPPWQGRAPRPLPSPESRPDGAQGER